MRIMDLPVTAAKATASRPGVQFTETMRGFLSTRVLDDYARAAEAGEQDNSPFAFTLTIRSDDLDAMLTNPDHLAGIVGTVEAPALSPAPLTVTEGRFQLFVADPEHVRGRRMCYRMRLSAEDGRTFWFEGYKLVNDDRGTDIWRDTSTLYVTVHGGENAESPVVGKGVLHIKPGDFALQMTTLKVLNTPGRLDRLKALARFGKFFAGSLWNVYGSVLERASYLSPEAPPRKRRPLRMEPPTIHPFTTGDGVALRLTRYQGGSKGPVILAPGFGTSTLAYTIDTTDTNLPEFLYARGYDVWLLDYRASPELPVSSTQFTVDDIATQDWPAAVATVREVSGASSVQVMGHCVGWQRWLPMKLIEPSSKTCPTTSAVGSLERCRASCAKPTSPRPTAIPSWPPTSEPASTARSSSPDQVTSWRSCAWKTTTRSWSSSIARESRSPEIQPTGRQRAQNLTATDWLGRLSMC